MQGFLLAVFRAPPDVSEVGHQAAELQTGQLLYFPRQLDAFSSWRQSAATHADVELHKHADSGPLFAGGTRKGFSRRLGVHRDEDSPPLRESGKPAKIFLAEDRVGNQDVIEPRRDHDFRLSDLGDGEAHGSALELHSGHFGRLVRLGVRAKPHTLLAAGSCHAVKVSLQDVEVNRQGGSGDFSKMHVTLNGVCRFPAAALCNRFQF
ncbi:MAG: hypothetical protein DMG23_07010 [Acidobacteria bacterium]|nr:MAG: hypothetical protein DMG23_07010 [Acidobacteriota bacterium]